MIAQTRTKMQKQQWQIDLANSFNSLTELLDYCEITPADISVSPEAAKTFRLFVTKSWAKRIKKGDANDPMLRQVIPLTQELTATPGYSKEPLEEGNYSPTAGLIHKYNGRVLVTLSGQCAVNCRYCFRRNFPYNLNQFNQKNWQEILAYIAKNDSIHEVILSGGDPLILPDRILKQVVDDISNINHIKYVRVHSRIPLALPSRITDGLIELFTNSKLKTTFVIHANCAQELDTEVITKLHKLAKSGFGLLNQSVLLSGVNDNANSLIDLSHKLFMANVMPYYLHRLDKVSGSAHFAVSEDKEKLIYQDLLANLPGYLVPKLVREIPQKKSKVPIYIDI